MPISHLVKYPLSVAAIFLGSTVAAQAQSDLPGCADETVKQTVLDIIAENAENARKGQTDALVFQLGNDWQLDNLALSNITLQDIHEATGRLTCNAALDGQKDRTIYNNMPEWHQVGREFLEERGYWDWRNISQIFYHISQSAEDPDYFVVSVVY